MERKGEKSPLLHAQKETETMKGSNERYLSILKMRRFSCQKLLPEMGEIARVARRYMYSFLNYATSITGPKSNFIIRHNFTRTSSNIIYYISCSKSCKLFFGQTGRRLSDRLAEYLRSVRNNHVDNPVTLHFTTANYSISDIKICAISPISGGNYSR